LKGVTLVGMICIIQYCNWMPASGLRYSGIAFLRHSGLDPESRKDRLDTGVCRYDEDEGIDMTEEIN
jgi:hypothetical protein